MSLFSKNFFLIAEAGINHNGNLREALNLVDAAKKCGANAIKFQTYITEKRTKKNSPIFKILKKCELPFSDFEVIKKYCDKKKIIFFSTPFDKESVQFLNHLKVKLFKVASFDISNFELLEEISKTKNPTIISTGMASTQEITKTYNFFKKKKIEIALLHCVSSYPNSDKTSYLSNINYLKKKYNCKIGLSDHTNDIKVPIYSYLLGSNIIEKHFKINSKHRCVDSAVSITSLQFKKLRGELNNIDKILGSTKFGVRKEEKFSKQFKRKKIY